MPVRVEKERNRVSQCDISVSIPDIFDVSLLEFQEYGKYPSWYGFNELHYRSCAGAMPDPPVGPGREGAVKEMNGTSVTGFKAASLSI